jgi:RNA polymerase sigma-70 factor (ECF subfamily)
LDETFFTILYKLHAERVRNALERLRIPLPDREDLVQEVFAVAVRKYRRGYPEKTWLLMVTHNVARNWYRRPYRRELPAPGPTGGSTPAEPADHRSPEQFASEREIHACIHSIIDDSLDEELRDVFTLAYIEGVSIEELALLLNVSPSKVQSMLRRARNAFLKEGRRRHAAGALLSALPLLAAAGESRLRAGFKEFLKYAGSAVGGAGLALALTRPEAVPTPIHAERTHLAETRWSVAAMPPADPMPAPPLVNPMPAPPGDTLPAKAIDPEPRPLLQASPTDMDEAARDELMLIERAKRAIRQRRYAEARQYLERHRNIYPKGKMSTLRDELFGQVKSSANSTSTMRTGPSNPDHSPTSRNTASINRWET